MPDNSGVTNRITSEKIYIEFLPCQTVEAEHVQQLVFDSAVDGGTFKLWVNGEITGAITMTGTAATDVSAINTALDALPNLSSGDIVASGSDITDITLTASGYGNGFFRILIEDDSLTQSTPNSNTKLQTTVTTQGATWTKISTDISAVDWSASAETVDVTAISEYERTEIPVATTVGGTISVYKTAVGSSDLALMMYEGSWGTMRIFPEGKLVGKEIIAFRALIEEFSEDYPDHEKIEIEISFMRQGAWISRPQTIYRV